MPFFDQCVSQMKKRAMTSIANKDRNAGYKSTIAAVRYHSPEPLYSAVWMVSAEHEQRSHAPTHTHDFPEVNILAAAPGDLVYRILIGDEEREVQSPASILIPAQVPHAANIVRGVGAFVVIRLMPEQLDNYGLEIPG